MEDSKTVVPPLDLLLSLEIQREGVDSPRTLDSRSRGDGDTPPSPNTRRLPLNLCERRGHRQCLFTYVCSFDGCKRVLLCAKCKKSHEKIHSTHIKKLDEWFNGMFCRRVEDSENNKVSRKCGMHLGRLNEENRKLEEETNLRKAKLTLQTENLIAKVTESLQDRLKSAHAQLDTMVLKHTMTLGSQQAVYKKLKNLNRFTILENLRRQHETKPPIIPIEEIIRFLLASEDQLADITEIENHHKRFSKLLRDLEAVEVAINVDKKILQRQTSEESPMNDNDYFLRDSLGMEKLEEGLSDIFEDSLSLVTGKRRKVNAAAARKEKESVSNGRRSPVNRHPLTSHERRERRKATTTEEVLKEVQLRLTEEQEEAAQTRSISLEEEEETETEKEEEEYEDDTEYVCTVQENFNSASFVEMESETLSVFAESAVSLYGLGLLPFTKARSLVESVEIADSSEESIYEIGAIKQVNFFTARPLSQIAFEEPQTKKATATMLIVGFKSDPARIEVWDMSSHKKLCEKTSAHECSITAVTILEVIPNIKVVFATSSYDGVIKTWQISQSEAAAAADPTFSLEQLALLKGHSDFITCMKLLKLRVNQESAADKIEEREYLVSAGSDKKVILWDWKQQETTANPATNEKKQQKQTPAILLPPAPAPTPPLPASAGYLASPIPTAKRQLGFLTKQIKITSLFARQATIEVPAAPAAGSNVKTITPFKVIATNHSDKVNCIEYLDEGFVGTGSSDSTIKIWDFDTFSEAKVLQNKFIISCVSRLNRGMLVCAANNVKMSEYIVNIWNWETGEIVSTIKSHTGRITRVHVARANTIVTCERNKVIRLWQPLSMQNHQLHPTQTAIESNFDLDEQIAGGTALNIQLNPAEQFLQNYHIELDYSLTPKYINLASIGSNWNIPTTPYDKTPITSFSAAKTEWKTTSGGGSGGGGGGGGGGAAAAAAAGEGTEANDECSWDSTSTKGALSINRDQGSNKMQQIPLSSRVTQPRSSIEDMMTSKIQQVEGSDGSSGSGGSNNSQPSKQLSMISRLNQQMAQNSGQFQNRVSHLTSILRNASFDENCDGLGLLAGGSSSESSQYKVPKIQLGQQTQSCNGGGRGVFINMMSLEEAANESENNSPIEDVRRKASLDAINALVNVVLLQQQVTPDHHQQQLKSQMFEPTSAPAIMKEGSGNKGSRDLGSFFDAFATQIDQNGLSQIRNSSSSSSSSSINYHNIEPSRKENEPPQTQLLMSYQGQSCLTPPTHSPRNDQSPTAQVSDKKGVATSSLPVSPTKYWKVGQPLESLSANEANESPRSKAKRALLFIEGLDPAVVTAEVVPTEPATATLFPLAACADPVFKSQPTDDSIKPEQKPKPMLMKAKKSSKNIFQ